MKRATKAVSKKVWRCAGGPMQGYEVALSVDSGSATGWLQIGAAVGRYIVRGTRFPVGMRYSAQWEPMVQGAGD